MAGWVHFSRQLRIRRTRGCQLYQMVINWKRVVWARYPPGGRGLHTETVPFSISLFIPTFQAEARAEDKEDGLKEKDYLTYFSAALSHDEVVTCALCGFNLQHQKEATMNQKHISSCSHATVFATCYELDQTDEKKLDPLFHWGKVEKVGIKQG